MEKIYSLIESVTISSDDIEGKTDRQIVELVRKKLFTPEKYNTLQKEIRELAGVKTAT